MLHAFKGTATFAEPEPCSEKLSIFGDEYGTIWFSLSLFKDFNSFSNNSISYSVCSLLGNFSFQNF
jgi:hypothetical protein